MRVFFEKTVLDYWHRLSCFSVRYNIFFGSSCKICIPVILLSSNLLELSSQVHRLREFRRRDQLQGFGGGAPGAESARGKQEFFVLVRKRNGEIDAYTNYTTIHIETCRSWSLALYLCVTDLWWLIDSLRRLSELRFVIPCGFCDFVLVIWIFNVDTHTHTLTAGHTHTQFNLYYKKRCWWFA